MTDPGPAERYARARASAELDRTHPITAAFAASQRFTLDEFQLEGCRALEEGRSVLVAAPTGAKIFGIFSTSFWLCSLSHGSSSLNWL